MHVSIGRAGTREEGEEIECLKSSDLSKTPFGGSILCFFRFWSQKDSPLRSKPSDGAWGAERERKGLGFGVWFVEG